MDENKYNLNAFMILLAIAFVIYLYYTNKYNMSTESMINVDGYNLDKKLYIDDGEEFKQPHCMSCEDMIELKSHNWDILYEPGMNGRYDDLLWLKQSPSTMFYDNSISCGRKIK